MSKLTIVARIESNPEKVELVKSELLKLVGPTLKENGCIQYDLYQDNDNSSVFLIYENWETCDLWQDHMKSSHLADFKKATDGAITLFMVNEMTLL